MITRPKQKIIAAITVSHGVYRKATFVLNGQPVKIYFLTAEEYRMMIDTLTPERLQEWAGMLQKVDSARPIYYCQWTVKVTEHHLITNKIQELVDRLILDEIGSLEIDLGSIEVRDYREPWGASDPKVILKYFFEEHVCERKAFSIEHNESTHFIDSEQLSEFFINQAPFSEQQAVYALIAQTDFNDVDIDVFLKQLAERYVKSNV